MVRTVLAGLALAYFALPSFAQSGGLQGAWKTPGGAIVQVAPCGSDLCATLVALEPNSPSQFDSNNPDAAKHTQKLCGLRLGYGFHLTDPSHAQDGYLYDPKSGKTYRGTLANNGDHLSLRGYVGIRAFGRSEQWTRVAAPSVPCR